MTTDWSYEDFEAVCRKLIEIKGVPNEKESQYAHIRGYLKGDPKRSLVFEIWNLLIVASLDNWSLMVEARETGNPVYSVSAIGESSRRHPEYADLIETILDEIGKIGLSKNPEDYRA